MIGGLPCVGQQQPIKQLRASGIRQYEALAAKLSVIPGVRSVTPVLYQTVLLSFAGEARGVGDYELDNITTGHVWSKGGMDDSGIREGRRAAIGLRDK